MATVTVIPPSKSSIIYVGGTGLQAITNGFNSFNASAAFTVPANSYAIVTGYLTAAAGGTATIVVSGFATFVSTSGAVVIPFQNLYVPAGVSITLTSNSTGGGPANASILYTLFTNS